MNHQTIPGNHGVIGVAGVSTRQVQGGLESAQAERASLIGELERLGSEIYMFEIDVVLIICRSYMCMYIYIYIYIHLYTYICIYIPADRNVRS